MTKQPEPLEIVSRPAHDERFCGRCQSTIPIAIEIHHCVKAPRKRGYEWRERVTDKLIERFPRDGDEAE